MTKTSRRSVGLCVFAFSALVAIGFAQTQNARGDGPLLAAEGDQIWKILMRLPYTPEGNGPTVYVIAYSTCPYTVAFNHDWAGKLDKIQIRWVLFAVDDQTANTTADAALARDPAILAGILSHSRVSRPMRSSPDRIRAFNSVVNPINQMNSAFAQFHHSRILSPTFVWRNKDQIFAVRGYEIGTFERLVLPSVSEGK